MISCGPVLGLVGCNVLFHFYCSINIPIKVVYRPFIKPNTTPLFMHIHSNHPPSIIKNIPIAVNKRLSSISSSKEEFKKATPIFKEALEKSGYKAKLLGSIETMVRLLAKLPEGKLTVLGRKYKTYSTNWVYK